MDDNPTDRLLIERAILRVIDKPAIEKAPGGREAISMLDTGEYDVVVTDQLLPGGVTSRDILRFATRREIPTFTVSHEPGLFHGNSVIDKRELYTAHRG